MSDMDKATIQRLNAINREFYAITAEEFDQTRGTAWGGWEELIPYLQTPISVLDVGCGNGRFGVFLRDHIGCNVQYHGVDNNAALLQHARAALDGMEATLEMRDVVDNPPDTGEYDLVAAFGLIHHIPGKNERQDFIRRLAARVKSGGMLAFACWRFYEYERFRERIVAWPEGLAVEAGDYLLDWRRGQTALRYCHYVDDVEHAALIAASGLREVVTFRADGQDRRANQYSFLRKT